MTAITRKTLTAQRGPRRTRTLESIVSPCVTGRLAAVKHVEWQSLLKLLTNKLT